MAGPQQADYFFVPLLDGTHGVGQVITDRPALLIGLSMRRGTPGREIHPMAANEYVALLHVETGSFIEGSWKLGGFDQLPRLDAATQDHIAATADQIYEPAMVEGFLNACHNLYPWDSFGDLFDQMLRPGVDRTEWTS